MLTLQRPFTAKYPIAKTTTNIVASINSFINLLVNSERGCCIADPDFGFALEDFHYEAFSLEKSEFFDNPFTRIDKNDNLATITDPMHDRNIIGTSKNYNTFAENLKASIEKYEKRLKDVVVDINYILNGRIIRIEINATINDDTNNHYNYCVYISIW